MIRLLFIVILIVTGLLVGPHLVESESYVLVAFNGWTLETSLAVMVMLIIVFYAGLQLAEWAVVNTFGMWGRTRHWLGWRKERLARKNTLDGVLALASGRFAQAEQLSTDAVAHSPQPVLNYVTAINAAAEQGKHTERDKYLQQALEYDAANIMLLATKLRFMVEAKDFTTANDWIEEQLDAIKYHDDILVLNAKVKRQVAQWHEVITINNMLLKRKFISAIEHKTATIESYLNLLKQAGQAGFEQGKDYYHAIPRKYRKHVSIFSQYALMHIDNGDSEVIVKELFKRCHQQLEPPIMAVLYRCPAKHAADWLNRLANVEQYQQQVTVLDLMAHLSQLARQWQQAKTYLMSAIEQEPNATRYQALAVVQQQLGENNGALDSFNQAIECRKAH